MAFLFSFFFFLTLSSLPSVSVVGYKFDVELKDKLHPCSLV